MELLQKYIKVAVMVCMFWSVASCGSDDTPDPTPPPVAKTQEELISESWRVVSVVREGQTMSSSSFRINFKTDKTYEFTTSDVPGFPQAGTWIYQASTGGNIIKLDGTTDLRIIGTITQTSFVFDYTYSNHKMGDVVVRFTLGPP